jgi:hypothetical protein
MNILGIYYTPLNLGYSSGKTMAANPPFGGTTMTIENSPADNSYIYRLNPRNACEVMRRPNTPHSRFAFYLRRDTPQEAKRALWQLQGKDEQQEPTND